MKIILLILSVLIISSCSSQSFDCGVFTLEINATKDKAKKTFQYPNEDISFNYYKDSESNRYIYFKGGDGSNPAWDKRKNEFYDCEL